MEKIVETSFERAYVHGRTETVIATPKHPWYGQNKLEAETLLPLMQLSIPDSGCNDVVFMVRRYGVSEQKFLVIYYLTNATRQ